MALKCRCVLPPIQIKAAYRELALRCHPDVVPHAQRPAAEAQFKGVTSAYSALLQPGRTLSAQQGRGQATRDSFRHGKPASRVPLPLYAAVTPRRLQRECLGSHAGRASRPHYLRVGSPCLGGGGEGGAQAEPLGGQGGPEVPVGPLYPALPYWRDGPLLHSAGIDP